MGFAPIRHYLIIVFKHFGAVPSMLMRVKNIGTKLLRPIGVVIFGVGCLSFFVGDLLKFFAFLIYTNFFIVVCMGIAFSILTIMFSSIALLIIKQYQLARIATQQTLTGNLTFEILKKIFQSGGSNDQ